MEHVQGNAFIQNGYAGLEALFQCEGLDLNDVQYLYNLLGQDGDVFDLVLRSRPNPPSEISLGAILASLGLKREIASLITEYEPGRLAQRVFGTVTALRRVLIKYREMENQVRKLGKTSISDALKAQSENRNLRRQHKFLGDYWAREVKRLLDEKYDSTRRFREDVRKIYHEREENKQALEEEVLALNEKLKDAAMHRQILERQLRQSRFDASLLMDFLNEHSTLSFNWERLQNLLAHFQKGTEPPSSWKTAISIMAHDDMTFQSKAYIPSSRRDDGDKTQAGLLPPGNLYSQSVDLTRNPPSGKSHLQTLRTGSGMRKGSFTKLSRKALAKVQWRPSDWDPVDEGCRPPLEKLVYTEQEAREALDVGVIWDQIRLDVRNTMRVGIKYRGALEWMREDRVAHALFHQTDLVSMLASMMYWKRLDESFWTKFVPERYFLAAEVRLEDLQVLNEQPPFWNPLPIEDENEIILPEAIHDYVDDKAKDEDYVDGEEADPEDEELDELVDESPCSRLFKRGRSSLSSDSEASKSKRIRAVKRSPLAHKKFEELTLAEKTVIESRFPDYAINQKEIKFLKPRLSELKTNILPVGERKQHFVSHTVM
ncbi:hypothetical protein BBO99_00009538 [Phytophthora kernoviae]|uniref:Uncharacterized protein n=2 Tax=Phytophthora kernoviae TaxID=325452 RepID=A0A3R7N9X2_9STRA|nr:hypothetical protein JM18_009579 [Phytophthora kernoviae]KAG2510574.1 hypothetical protein JM16_007999 [Phytophthora kernoviae]RLN32061.1 hypothetical protein BBI17_008220 [Phytophthora kernoviae]RLN73115.1 hypothetical protein BBO99_00009538 [Phytophthora kernoviae]